MKYDQKIEQLLQTLGASALKRYGQYFLVDQEVIAKIIAFAKLAKVDHVIEIGPGLGAITQPLIEAKVKYTSYEIDQTYQSYLQKTYPTGTHHRLNFLKAPPQHVDVIVGNLPYYVTTEIIEKIYKDFAMVKRLVLMVQKEVLPRLLAKPGDLAYGPLAIYLATLGHVTPVLDVPPQAFYPEPHVISSVFILEAFEGGPLVDTKPFFYFIKKMFLHRRKTILNNLSGLLGDRLVVKQMLDAVGIQENIRPEMISVEDYRKLFHRMPANYIYNK